MPASPLVAHDTAHLDAAQASYRGADIIAPWECELFIEAMHTLDKNGLNETLHTLQNYDLAVVSAEAHRNSTKLAHARQDIAAARGALSRAMLNANAYEAALMTSLDRLECVNEHHKGWHASGRTVASIGCPVCEGTVTPS